ncbi:hypothetical protein F5883DRAFT_574032 [Diaporthe sp. PMI_573]|nr:hypothetical protein F5883DRAFT_574032 [Diaporthaceae sp. PMI_573]
MCLMHACSLLRLVGHGVRGDRWGDLVKDFLEQGVRKYLLLPSLEQRLPFAGSLLFAHLSNETQCYRSVRSFSAVKCYVRFVIGGHGPSLESKRDELCVTVSSDRERASEPHRLGDNKTWSCLGPWAGSITIIATWPPPSEDV